MKQRKMADLVKAAAEELEAEKIDLAKDVLKQRILEITKAENVLKRLKENYQSILNKPIDEVVEGIENGNIRI